MTLLSQGIQAQWNPVGSSTGMSAAATSFENLVEDASGNYYLSYYDLSVSKGSVQKFDGTIWSYLGGTPGITTGSATYNTLAVDHLNNVYYTNQAGYPSTGLNARKFDGTSWNSLPDAESVTVNFQASGVTSTNDLIVAYRSGSSITVKKYNGTTWSTLGNTGFSSDAPYYIDLAVATDDMVYVSFVSTTNQQYVYSISANALSTDTWQMVGGTAVAPASNSEQNRSSLALDGSNNIYVAYTSLSSSGNKLNVQKYNGVSWQQVGGANFSPYRVHYVSLAVSNSGTPYVAFSNFESSPNNKNMVMTFNGTIWDTVGVGSVSANKAFYNSLLIDQSGNLVLAYSDQVLSKAVVKKYALAGCVAPNAPNNITPVAAQSICANKTTTLSVSGTGTIHWYTSPTSTLSVGSGSSYTTSALAAGTYTYYTTATTCTNSAMTPVTFTVNTLPSVSATTTKTILCIGETAVLSASGATTFTWSNASTGSSISVNPTVTTTYTINGTDANGCSNLATITQTVSVCTGIESSEERVTREVMVYPNPSNGQFVIEAGDVTNVVIFDLLGNVVYSNGLNPGKNTIKLTEQANGIYFIRTIMKNGHIQNIKVIKQ